MAPANRDYIRINISTVPSELKNLVSEFPRNVQFTERHGHLHHLVTSKFEEDMIRVLFQFFDPEHHCFTFPDYQLVPTLEEFSELIGLPVRDQLPFTGLERIPKPKIMVLAISCRVIFFRSTTPFCCGVLGQEKSWAIPFSLKNSSKNLFSNLPP